MVALKRIPIHYKGELHDVRLVNFSVDPGEVRNVPAGIKVRNFNGRALISMVDVKLKNMRPSFLPESMSFDYRHIAFRLLVNDSQYNEGFMKGIFFLRSFTDKALIVAGGSLFTEYNLESARIKESLGKVSIRQDSRYVEYSLSNREDVDDSELTTTIGALDRAYSVLENRVQVTQIQREKWPIKPVKCTDFKTNYFETARFEGAFRVFETIYYEWLPPKNVEL